MAKRRVESLSNLQPHRISIEVENDTGERKQRKKLERTFHYWHEFCNNTSLHGLKYLGEPHRPVAERIWWVISISVSIIACVLLISKTYRKWDTSPVIVSFAEASTPILHIPFPAVTICSEIKVRRTVFNYTKVLLAVKEMNYTDEQMENLQYASILCNWQPFRTGNLTLDHEKVVSYIRKVSPSLDDMLMACFWQGEEQLCSSLFSPVFTDEGLCYTFNSLGGHELLKEGGPHVENDTDDIRRPARNWTLEGGYTRGAGKNVYPQHTHSAGSAAGLIIRYSANDAEMDPWCRWPVLGFKVLLHSPVDYPQVGNQFFRVPLNRDVVVGVRPSMMNTSDGLRSYLPTRRQCLLSSERQLRFFRIYTQNNCEFECITNYTMQMCNCTTFFMPRAENASICGAGSNTCVGEVLEKLVKDNESVKKCACVPACTEIKYDVETSQSHFAWYKLLEVLQLDKENNLTEFQSQKFGQISIYFKEMQFITSRRSELYGPTEFLANCGGLLGLFMGFSFLSLIEFLYFFTVRLFSNYRARRNAKNPCI